MKKTFLSTLMIVCIASVSFASVEKLATNNEPLHELTAPQVSPFCLAIVKGDLDTVKKMIEFGTDVNEKSQGMTPLMYAARYNRVEIIKLLVNKGAKIKTKNDKGYNAMKYAEFSNAKEAIAILEELS